MDESRVFIKAHQHVLLVQQFPGAGAVAETVHFVPQHVPPPSPHVVSRGTTPRVAGQQGKPHILHLVQMEDALQPDDQGEDAGQETPIERTVPVPAMRDVTLADSPLPHGTRTTIFPTSAAGVPRRGSLRRKP